MADETPDPATPPSQPAESAPPAATPPPATLDGSPVPEHKPLPKRIANPKLGLIGAVKASLASKKRKNRLWAILFLVSIAGITMSSIFVIQIWIRYRAYQAELKKKEELSPPELARLEAIEKKKKGEEYKKRNVSLGVFQFQMKPIASDPKPKGIQNIAQLEISILCDSVATCEYITANSQTIKDQITSSLVGFSRKDLMSTSGKISIQEKVLIKVNVSLPQGRIERVFFTKMILS